ncbi:MAG: GDP-L-fucose synthase [Bacteroidales bacterium]|nr:GDP-L-fucose synthase [Bacteroidales bacterium]
MNKDSKIYVAGNTGLVGSAIVRNLKAKGYTNFVFTPFSGYDLREQSVVRDFFQKEKPDVVFLAAAKVGGIVANNTYRADFIYDNLQIQNNIIHQCFIHKAEKLVFLGSSCIYPKNSPQPMSEEHLLTSELEYTNEPYAVAKIAGIKLIESYNLQYGTNFIAVMPTNLYGINDNFDLEKSHVLPALIRKMHLGKALMENDYDTIRKDLNIRPINDVTGDADISVISDTLSKFGINKQSVELWGSGKPRREFLHADDLADACVFIAEKINFKEILLNDFNISEFVYPYVGKEVRNTHINIGTGRDISIKELAELIKNELVNYKGEINWNTDKPDGTSQKLLDVRKLHSLGWKEKIDFLEGIKDVYKGYVKYAL